LLTTPTATKIAWAADETRELLIASLLNRAKTGELGGIFRMEQRLSEEKETIP
jgi:hypothetical protein